MEAYSYAGGHHRPTRGPVTTDSLMPNIPENKTMDVTFHVALSKKKWDAPQVKLLMLIVTNEDEEISGHTLRMTDETDSKYLEFATSFTIAEPSHFTSLEYKYVFVLDDGSKVPEHRHGCALPSAKRHLNLNKCSGTDKTYHRYDGIVRNKRSKKFFENNDTKLKNDMEKAAQFFIRKINIASSSNSFQGLNGEQLILRLEMLKKGMKEVYWGANENGRKERSSLLKQIMTTAFKPLLEDIRRNCHKEEDTRLMMLINATLVAYCLVKQIVELSDDDKELMCKALLPRMDQEKKCPDLIVLNKAFPNTMSQMISALHSLSKTMIYRPGKLSWIYIMPLIHFMDKKCIPWQEAPDDINHDAKVPHWWGIVLGEHKLDFETFKSVRIESETLSKIRDLVPYFEMDYLLPRSLMSCIRFDQILDTIKDKEMTIPSDVIIATLYFYIRSKTTDGEIEDIKSTINSCLFQVYNGIERDIGTHMKQSISSKWRTCKIACDMLRVLTELVGGNKCTHVIKTAFRTALATLHLLQHSVGNIKIKDKEVKYGKDIEAILDDICDAGSSFVEKSFSLTKDTSMLKEVLETCRQLLKSAQSDSTVVLAFKEHIKDLIKEKLKKKWQNIQLVKLYCSNASEDCPLFVHTIEELVFEALEIDRSKLVYHSMTTEEKMVFGQLMSKQLTKKLIGLDLDHHSDRLRFCLTWDFFPIYIKIQGVSTESYFSTECTYELDIFKQCLINALRNIEKGCILISDLRLIHENKKQFSTLLKNLNQVQTEPSIEIRMKELEVFELRHKTIQKFSDFCQIIRVDTKVLDGQLAKNNDLSNYPLNSICLSTSTSSDLSADDEEGNFNLDADTLKKMSDIVCYSEGFFFKSLWIKHGQLAASMKGSKLIIEEVLTTVWEDTFEEWNELYDSLKKGSIFCSQFNDRFSEYTCEEIRRELEQFETDKRTTDWINERIQQYDRYKDMITCRKAANTVMEMKDNFTLQGDFTAVENILQCTGDRDVEMSKFEFDYLTMSDIRKIDETKIKCLQAFCKSKTLVEWLRKSMKNGLQELKIFVDLAYNATRDEEEILRVTSLQSSVNGYSSLIFDMNESMNFKQLFENCEKVWKTLAEQPILPVQLEHCCQFLEWYKKIEESLGSVQKNALSEAEIINSKGRYMIRNLTQKQDVVLQEILQLSVVDEKDGNYTTKLYTFDDLNDLQSRLMLIGSKVSERDVDRFLEVFDSMKILGDMIIKMLASGCALFLNFQVEFRCDRDSTVCLFISFDEKLDKKIIKGKTSKNEQDDCLFVCEIANFLADCLHEWEVFLDLQRDKHHFLNFFPVKQLVFLQHEIAKLGTNQNPSVLLYPLLSVIKKDCSEDDVIAALKDAQLELVKIENERKADVSKPEIQNHLAEEVSDFISAMIESNFPKSLALEALKHFPPTDISEAITWCLENQDLHGNQESTPLTEDDIPTWILEDKTAYSILAGLLDIDDIADGIDLDKEKALTNLKGIWKNFLVSVSSSVSDFLSVEHLALILNMLARQGQTHISRSFAHCGCEEGVPNLFICPQSEMYTTVLSIYYDERAAPLPQSDEVVLCTEKTTFDMIDTFLRRVFFGSSDRIHCLVNVDFLEYEVSDRAEMCLDKYMNSCDKDLRYKLVVTCGSKNEFRSRMVAALDKYRRPHISVKEQQVKNHLSEKLKTTEENIDGRHAYSVDFNRSRVRVVKSYRAGMGKTLFAKNMRTALLQMRDEENLEIENEQFVTIPLYEKYLDMDAIVEVLLNYTKTSSSKYGRIFHIDIAHEVEEGVDPFLFQLLVLGCVTHKSGHVWRTSDMDYYIIETMPLLDIKSKAKVKCLHQCLNFLPDVLCRSPLESRMILSDADAKGYQITDIIFDETVFKSDLIQRPYRYLKSIHKDQSNLQNSKKDCLDNLYRFCGVKDPSWSEIYHFAAFLNRQLEDFETSIYCSELVKKYLPGFKDFVLKFLIQMSKDFAIRSLNMSEESPLQMLKDDPDDNNEEDLAEFYRMRRTWETSPHPYLFFNPDHNTISFLGFYVNKESLDLIDHQTKRTLETKVMSKVLFQALVDHGVDLKEQFDDLERKKKIDKLCTVMDISDPCDPDPTYELTTDNVKKILAIYMRFRCNIPVMIMGETGSGKTRLVEFMCALQNTDAAPIKGNSVKNMIVVKVHGGTTATDIGKAVKKAEEVAKENAKFKNNSFTVLFFDEANTTESIGAIKEVMCDKCIQGKPIQLFEQLKIVAACNPYRKHKEDLIKTLEQAGLGYHVSASKTKDRLGRVPMRRLVYRVQPLPQSMIPLVWDFGQLNTNAELLYIKQMICRYIKEKKLPALNGLDNVLSKLLSDCQNFMRLQQNECSFVSLRDVERVLDVAAWFMRKDLFELKNISRGRELTRSLLIALRVCYEACLKNTEDFRKTVKRSLKPPLEPSDDIQSEVKRCRDSFLDHVELPPNIARNAALKDNVFLMIVCIELKIPMFLVGKPGSSKSLSKTIVFDNMRGANSREPFFKNLKEIQMVSFQCSPLSRAESIIGTFKKGADLQKNQDANKFVSVVVLDEIGLAEDSETMPLKTLHSLLEEGCPTDEGIDKILDNKVSFIGISNWALDPAKMNRGIFVRRDVPNENELKATVWGICQTSEVVKSSIELIIPYLATGYMKLCRDTIQRREFFGLRDFYSLIKLVYAFAERKKQKPSWNQLKYAIMRNFGGLECVDPVSVFCQQFEGLAIYMNRKAEDDDPDCSPVAMIQACLDGDQIIGETRYLLLLAENYGDLNILQEKILARQNAVVIFGSSFAKDQEYTQVCRNINRIKVCMETGTTVILLNLENLYESLYDAMNQYYVECFGQRFVELGLGNHRVKCRVHPDFRLIVVALKDMVYNKFPTPLINRLEKHILSLKTMLSLHQQNILQRLKEWVESFCQPDLTGTGRCISDVFMGHHDDTIAAVILHLSEDICFEQGKSEEDEVFEKARNILLWCTTPDAVLTLNSVKFKNQTKEDIIQTYFGHQQHDNLLQCIKINILEGKKQNVFLQVTTHSKLLSTSDYDTLWKSLLLERKNTHLLTLQSFDTEQQFCKKIREIFTRKTDNSMYTLLIIQCESGDQNGDLIACARYSIQSELQHLKKTVVQDIHVILVVQIPRITCQQFTGFQCGVWHSLHIDEVRPSYGMPAIIDMYKKPLSVILDSFLKKPDSFETPLDVISVIWGCIQKALSLVQDADADEEHSACSRTTTRVKMIFSAKGRSMQSNGGKTFMDGLALHLVQLIKEKEKQSLGIKCIISEAVKPELINRAGTFRKSIIQCIEGKIIHTLAGILAFIDKNRNMDILSNESSKGWRSSLWIEVINNPGITQLTYTHFLSHSNGCALTEFIVKGTSKEGKTFNAKMPFSWLIFQEINLVLKDWKNRIEIKEGNYSDILMKIVDTLKTMPLGKLIEQIHEEHMEELLQDYLCDFVEMTYPVKCQMESKLVCKNMLIGCSQITPNTTVGILYALARFHIAFSIFEERFRNFSTIVQVWPACSERSWEFSNTNHQLAISDVNLDLIGLQLLLNTLEQPKADTLNTSENRIAWMKTLCQYRPVIERVLDSHHHNRNEISVKAIDEARILWTRAFIMKLFIEHVCTEDSEVGRCMPLWLILKKSNMKTVESLMDLEKFLRSYNAGVAYKALRREKCEYCETKYQEAPVTLPCNHTVCRNCYRNELTSSKIKCSVCGKTFEADFQTSNANERKEVLEFKTFMGRCNSFFMDVVSQLCFARGVPPSEKVIEKLLSYITVKNDQKMKFTKELTVFNDCIDRTPVVRSFLLQRLLQTSGENVMDYLKQFFERAKELVSTVSDTEKQIVDLCLLVLNCLEDRLHQQNASLEQETIRKATKIVVTAEGTVDSEQPVGLGTILLLSNTRFALNVGASCLHSVYIKKRMGKDHCQELIDGIRNMFDRCQSKMPKFYFIKYLCKAFGIANYQMLRENCPENLQRMITDPELTTEDVEECSDRFISCNNYTDVRDRFFQFTMNGDKTAFEDLIQEMRKSWKMEILFRLVMYREITFTFLQKGSINKDADKIRKFVEESLVKCSYLTEQPYIGELLNNTIWKDDLRRYNISPGMTLKDQGLSYLLTHFAVVLKKIPRRRSMLEPFKNIASQPESMMTSLFPVMPQDDLFEIYEVLKKDTRETLVMFKCPNGHPYLVGDCGKPVQGNVCKKCRKPIGGVCYNVLAEGNIKYEGEDMTQKGHILERADKSTDLFPERSLGISSCGIVRLLTHLAMLIGSNTNINAISDTIHPSINKEQVPEFLVQHIENDISLISKTLGKNEDDVLLMIHCLFGEICNDINAHDEELSNDSICFLMDKTSRAQWEDNLNKRHIITFLENADNMLRDCSDKLAKDDHLGKSPLDRLLFETDKYDGSILWENPSVWRYREHVSLEHLKTTIMKIKQKYTVLRLFLDEEHFLRYLQYVPSIIRLQKMLIQRYKSRLDKIEASDYTLARVKEDFEKDENLNSEFVECLEHFIKAWESVRESMIGYICAAGGHVVQFKDEFRNKNIDDFTPVSFLLPTYTDEGLLSYLLLHFLLEKHNSVLERFCQSKQIGYHSLFSVQVNDLTSAHIISYNPDHDFLPMILANCSYTFHVGSGINLEYNYSTLERQVVDRFLLTKSNILINGIEIMVYRSETTNSMVFEILRTKIPQERMSPAVMSQIRCEMNRLSYPDLCDNILNIDTAICFLKSFNRIDHLHSFNDFVVSTLQLGDPCLNQKLKMSNIQSLWVTLSMEKTKRLLDIKKESFDTIPKTLKDLLTERERQLIMEIGNKLQEQQLGIFLEILFECIVLVINIPQKDEEFTDMSKISLADAITLYLDDQPYENKHPLDSWLDNIITRLKETPGDKILCSKCTDTWITLFEINKLKQREI